MKSHPIDPTRQRIASAGLALLAKGGPEAVTTRAVGAAARVQGPTIYRLFGDKQGLLYAVAELALQRFVAQKRSAKLLADPIDDLRAGWDLSVAFGLAHPGVYSIIHAEPNSPLAVAGVEVLAEKISRIAKAGHLRVSESRAVELIRAGGTGTVMVLMHTPAEQRDLTLSTTTRELIIAAITSPKPVAARPSAINAALALRASLPETDALSPGEKLLLTELLDRLASSAR